MRGKPRSWRILPRVFGITPAGAGKTKSSSVRLFAHRDHPRGCGENRIRSNFRLCAIGSPPRMRGKRSAGFLKFFLARITPADAGKTGVYLAEAIGIRDHPRGCGENQRRLAVYCDSTGSPPRMRGKQVSVATTGIAIRITPADAGKTRMFPAHTGQVGDHPRGCGENFANHNFLPPKTGSPPRMRGKHQHLYRLMRALRITPADAGKTVYY